jgi:2,3-bisphosphoglycerate-independent phosphoglycerate mutase
MKNYDKIMLVILDGWGHGPKPEVSAITQANTPFVDSLYQKYPNSELVTYGEEVGLPEGQMGNSEVGHLNIGAGRVVYQELVRINKAIREKTLQQNETLLNALNYAKANDTNVHLVSDGGVHSHLNHLKGICDITEEHGLRNVFIHAFMDGRDTAPKGGLNYLKDVAQHIKNTNVKVASVIGRYYAMDRDKRWERVKLAYDLLVNGTGEKTSDYLSVLQKPISVTNEDGSTVGTIQPNDVVICYNFRTDRCREITEVLTQQDMPEHGMKTLPLHYVTMTKYDASFKGVNVIFKKDNLANTLGEVLESAGKTQLRIAETEKYPHVTFFFSGGREKPFVGETRQIVPSPKVATYDLQPEMSAVELTDVVVKEINDNQPDFICLNYANADMVGHTGVFSAAMKATETVDACAKRLIETGQKYGYAAIIIADHGNSDYMINDDGTPNTAHTVNPVPCFFVTNELEVESIKNGKLGDIAPTILQLFGIEQPSEMDGISLLK